MRKIIFFMLTSLDGYFEGPGKDIYWHNVDDEFNEFAVEQLNSYEHFIVWQGHLRNDGKLLAHACYQNK